MARPAKSVSVSNGKISVEEKRQRQNVENTLKGSTDKIKPGSYLSKNQKKIFKNIVEELKKSKILGNLDVYILNQAAISIDRLQILDKQANEDHNLSLDKDFKSAHDMYTKQFFRCCNELCLSPQSRARLSISATLGSEPKKTIGDLLGDDDEWLIIQVINMP